jgi:hypothetical protein
MTKLPPFSLALGVPLLDPGTLPGTGLDRLEGIGVPPGVDPLPLAPLTLPLGTMPLAGVLAVAGAMGGLGRRVNHNQPHQVFLIASLSLSSLFLSNADRYRSYDSLNAGCTREEKISSPRGLLAGGMGVMGMDVEVDVDELEALDRVGDEGREG